MILLFPGQESNPLGFFFRAQPCHKREKKGSTKKKRTAAASSVVQVECDVSDANQSIPSIDYDILTLAIIKHSPHKTQEQSDPLPEDHTGPAVMSPTRVPPGYNITCVSCWPFLFLVEHPSIKQPV